MLYRILIFLFLALNFVVALAQEAVTPKSYGVLESWSYDQSTGRLDLKGWSLGGADGHQQPRLSLRVDGKTFDSKDVDWSIRDDIPSSHQMTGGNAGVGFVWRVSLPEGLPPGIHALRLTANFADGHAAVLQGQHSDVPTLIVPGVKRRHISVFVIVMLSIVAITWARRRRWLHTSSMLEGNAVILAVTGLFVVLVATGVTGSSMDVLFQSQYGAKILDVRGQSPGALKDEPIRGDEWGVQLPNVLAQLHHEPKFPVVNDLLGEGGQNMGVAGMTGVPVWQWAALARPATWGYFFLPLRQALAWQWQIPFWGGLLAFWSLLNVLRPAQRGLNLALACTFCLAPYAAAWSNWPLYVVMFPAAAFVVAVRLLKADSIGYCAILGMVLGWLLASWCLVLYPAWIIVTGSALGLIGAGWCLDNRRNLRFGWPQLVALGVAMLVLSALMGSWWLDTRDAIALMRSTEYPGARGSMPGGDLSWWWHLRGYHNLDSLRITGPHSNPSEASSYLVLPLLLVTTLTWTYLRDRSVRWTVLACGLFLAAYWIYTLIGVSPELARLTMWGQMPVTRMDVGIGLLGTVALCLFAFGARAPATWIGRWLILVVAVSSAGLAGAALAHTPLGFAPGAGNPLVVGTAVVIATMVCGWVLGARVGSAVALVLVVYAVATIPFNPIRIGPKDVELAEEPLHFLKGENGHLQRTLVIGDGIDAMVFVAAGVPVVNGVFYYPHRALWDRMGLAKQDWHKVNRYQHLGFYVVGGIGEKPGYSVVQAALDQVHVHINPRYFDFSCTGAKRVVAPAQFTNDLTDNPSLSKLGIAKGLAWFAVTSTSTCRSEANL